MKKRCAPTPIEHRETLTVSDMHPSGAGLARARCGRTVLLEGVLPGETAETLWREPAPGGRLGLALEVRVTDRRPTADRCPLAGRCGGCPLGRLPYPEELALKTEALLARPLREAGFDPAVLRPAVGHPEERQKGFRNKAVLYPTLVDGRLRFGFFEPRSHRVLPAEDCPQASDAQRALVRVLSENAAHLPLYDERTGEGLLRALLLREGRAGETVAALVVKAFPADAECARLTENLPEGTSLVLHRNPNPGNALLDFSPAATRILTGSGSVSAEILGLVFEVRPETFLQVNTLQTPVLYGLALDALRLAPNDSVLDLYCGVGTMTLAAARRAGTAVGVELVEASVEAARGNALRNGIANVRFEAGAVERVLPTLSLENPPTKAILDPAFKGLAENVPAHLAALPLTDLVYVSCNPKTLLRDVGRLTALDFSLESVTPVDLFPGAFHLEAVAVLRRSADEGRAFSGKAPHGT